MRLNKKILILGISLIIGSVLLFVYIFPFVHKVDASLLAYETRVANRDNYKLHTTPLLENVVEELCLKLDIMEFSEHCQNGVIVYAPELFGEIKTYFQNLPHPDRTYNVVQDKLGNYLDYCENPYPDGSYVCHYDLRGDNVYPILFFFDKKGTYYRIIANTGGS